jgi:hypothetical protein
MKETVSPDNNPRGWKPWSENEDRILRRETALKNSLDVIAKRHRRTESAVLHRMRKLKLDHPAVTAAALAWQVEKAKRALAGYEQRTKESPVVKDLDD